MAQVKFKLFGKERTIEDKTLHVWAGMFFSGLVGSSSYFFTHANYFESCMIGLFVGILAGAVKELVHDKWMGLGVASWADFFATLYGSFAGTALLAIVIGVVLTH